MFIIKQVDFSSNFPVIIDVFRNCFWFVLGLTSMFLVLGDSEAQKKATELTNRII